MADYQATFKFRPGQTVRRDNEEGRVIALTINEKGRRVVSVMWAGGRVSNLKEAVLIAETAKAEAEAAELAEAAEAAEA